MHVLYCLISVLFNLLCVLTMFARSAEVEYIIYDCAPSCKSLDTHKGLQVCTSIRITHLLTHLLTVACMQMCAYICTHTPHTHRHTHTHALLAVNVVEKRRMKRTKQYAEEKRWVFRFFKLLATPPATGYAYSCKLCLPTGGKTALLQAFLVAAELVSLGCSSGGCTLGALFPCTSLRVSIVLRC